MSDHARVNRVSIKVTQEAYDYIWRHAAKEGMNIDAYILKMIEEYEATR